MIGKELATNNVIRSLICSPSRSAVLLDLDGTLTEIRSEPEEVTVSEEMRESLSLLAERFAHLAIISGREAENARELVGLEGLYYVGNHGLETIFPDGKIEVESAANEFSIEVPELLKKVGDIARTAEGVRIENKRLSLSIHYRGAADPEEARKKVLSGIEQRFSSNKMRVIEGRMVVELRPDVDVDKGTAVAKLLASSGCANALYIGDDLTDVDAFLALRALPEVNSLSIAVASGEAGEYVSSSADLTLDNVEKVEDLLRYLAVQS